MAENKKKKADVKDDAQPHEEPYEYPGGLFENHGPAVLPFLKLTYVGFTLFAILYFVMYMAGDGTELVQQLNQATGH
ncbi:MAG: hypothetical protein CO108_01670 [Deltaproteobacteria bacterium CG_4_9_14_3_um_filter_63_12]|nr:MAG: hypothetical protein CO108_01670 [Deltaproteobacteria bacterium CG_4_9_14_3_um_filter_63_12]